MPLCRLIALLIVATSTIVAAEDERFRVFVTAARPDPAAFIDPSLASSARDIQGALRRGIFNVVTDVAKADVVVRVIDRGPSGETATVATRIGASVIAMPASAGNVLVVAIEVGDQAQAFTTPACATWKYCAGQVNKYLNEWVRENRASLLDRRRR